MNKSPEVDLLWYGERGIVNSLVTRIATLGIKGVKELLRCIQWADADQNQWIEGIASARMVVEVGLGQFGDPDLIIVCATGDGARYGVFVEAKAVPYFYSAEQGGRSRIQRQLTLKYRFVLALESSRGEGRIVEAETTHANYQRGAEGSDQADDCNYPRQLAKPSVLSLCRDAGLFDTPIENFRFVAWTWDSKPFYDAEDFAASASRPLFLQSDGTEDWQQTRSKLGWLGYAPLFDCDGLTDQTIVQAFHTMMPAAVPVDVPWIDCEDEGLKPYNINNLCSASTKDRLSRLETIAEQHFRPGSVKRLNGSTSITLTSPSTGQPKVLVKLLPRDHGPDEYIKLGISASLNRSQWAEREFNGPDCIAKQAFFTIDLPNGGDAYDIVSKAFAELAECVPTEDESEDV